jgi:hypothetical protein
MWGVPINLQSCRYFLATTSRVTYHNVALYPLTRVVCTSSYIMYAFPTNVHFVALREHAPFGYSSYSVQLRIL